MSNTTVNSCFVKFEINQDSFIALHIPHATPEELQMCEEIKGFYHDKNEDAIPVISSNNCIESQLECFMSYIKKLFRGEKAIDHAQISDLGYHWNERLYTQNKEGVWPGSKYLCFSTSDGAETFLYTENGNIILEIVPVYPWLFGQKPEGIKRIPFRAFMKTYEPYVKIIVPYENVEHWLVTARLLRDSIERNEQALAAKAEELRRTGGQWPEGQSPLDLNPALAKFYQPCPCKCHDTDHDAPETLTCCLCRVYPEASSD